MKRTGRLGQGPVWANATPVKIGISTAADSTVKMQDLEDERMNFSQNRAEPMNNSATAE